MTDLDRIDAELRESREAILRGDEPLAGLLAWHADWWLERRMVEAEAC